MTHLRCMLSCESASSHPYLEVEAVLQFELSCFLVCLDVSHAAVAWYCTKILACCHLGLVR